MSDWISTKERLPEYHVPVLAIIKDKLLSRYVYVAQRIEEGFWSFQNGYCGYWICPNEKIEWWMTLPELPKENEHIKRICKNCKYFRDMNYYCCCFGKKNAPRVEPEDSCESWKPKEE